MKKKFLIGLLVIVMCLTLVGCGNENIEANNADTTDNAVENQNDTSNNSADNEIELYSDSTKIVFKNGNSKLVYYYSGETITKYEAYLDYENSVTAKYALSTLEKDEDIKNIYTKGRYVIIEYDKSVYENLTTSEVRVMYSYLEEVQKNK